MDERTAVVSNDHFNTEYSTEHHRYHVTPRSSDAARALALAAQSLEMKPFEPPGRNDKATDAGKHGQYELDARHGYWLGRLLDRASSDAARRGEHDPGTALKPGTAPKACSANVPDTLTVVLADTYGTYLAVVHENEHRPFQRRTVQIPLTDEQRHKLRPRHTGMDRGKPTHEEFLTAWLEPATTPLPGQTSA